MRRRGILDLRLCAISALVPCLRVTQRTLSMLTLSVAGAAVVPTVPATCFPLGASRFSSARPARLRAGLSFGKCTNGLGSRQVFGLRRNRVIQRLSERLPHSPAITPAASSYRAHPAWHFVATAHLSTDQVNYWNKYIDTLVRYSRYICVNHRDKYSLYSAVYQLRVCRFISR